MKTITHGHATCKLGYSQAIPAHLRGNMLEISSLEVPAEHQNKGHARDLIAEICQNADNDRMCLMVMVEPFGAGLDQVALADWYARRFGFFSIQDSPALLMVRMPYATQPVRH